MSIVLTWLLISVVVRLFLYSLVVLISPFGILALLSAFLISAWNFEPTAPYGMNSGRSRSYSPCMGSCGDARASQRSSNHGWWKIRWNKQGTERSKQEVQDGNKKENNDTAAPPSNTHVQGLEKVSIAKASESLNETDTIHSRRFLIQHTPIQIDEQLDKLVLSFDVPGFALSDLKIKLEEGGSTLSISGERKNKLRDSFVFQRHFALNKAFLNSEGLKAHLSDGVLTVTVPKEEILKPRPIPIVEGNLSEKESPSGKAMISTVTSEEQRCESEGSSSENGTLDKSTAEKKDSHVPKPAPKDEAESVESWQHAD